MKIYPNSKLYGLPDIPDQTSSSPELGKDQLALTKTEHISRALDQTPAVRSDKVAYAKGLIDDPSYPPDVVIRKIASLLAIHLEDENQTR